MSATKSNDVPATLLPFSKKTKVRNMIEELEVRVMGPSSDLTGNYSLRDIGED
jgi:hypothetical protein